MSVPLQFDSLATAALPLSTDSGAGAARPLHLAIGMFDGVHLGHRSVIEAAISSARRSGGLAGVLTFWPHPSALFRPEKATKLLMPSAMKRLVLGQLGVDFIVEEQFSREFAAIEAGDFLPHLKRALPQLTAVYVGENWRFGRGRAGDVALLVAEGRKHGIEVYSAPRLNHNGAPISSSRIRELLVAGDVAGANALLGYAYFVAGTVQTGRQLGRTIGFPTLNLAFEPELQPRFGVYAVTVVTASGAVVPGVANYGLRPTVETAPVKPLLEVHLLGEPAATYGDFITVNWLHFLRAEAKFKGLEELRMQIARDRERALEFFRKKSAE